MLDKEKCKKCYQFHERPWDDDAEDEWENDPIFCPVDHFENMKYEGKLTKVEIPYRNMFGMIFGWREINDKIPKWCRFQE